MNKFFKILLISSVTFSLFSGPNEDLLAAAENGDSAGVEAAITAGADINDTDVYKPTALMEAAIGGHTDVVRLLLGRGAYIDANVNGRVVLIEAIQKGHIDIVRLLLDRSANVNEVNFIGITALMRAVDSGHTDTVRLLLDKGANIDHVSLIGDTALSLARLEGHTEIVKILQETLEIKQLVDNAIQGDSSAHQELIEKIKGLNIDSYEFNLILNRLINKIKDVGINRNSRKLLLDLAYHIAINLGSAVIGLLPEDILIPMLRGFFPDTDLEYEFDMMHLDADNKPIKRNLLEIIYAFYKKIEKLEEIEAELKVTHVLEYE